MTEAPAADALTILIPAAGEGSRFAAAGYSQPKPFIPVFGRPMLAQVIDNLRLPGARTVVVARATHVAAEPALAEALSGEAGVRWSLLDRTTEGTACTVLAARAELPADRPLLIANCDQWVEGGIAALIADARQRHLDGSILVFDSPPDPKWSYARLDGARVVEVAEKKPISNLATVGIYYFRTAQLFFDSAEAMIAADDRVNGEFYTCPVYNDLIRRGGNVGVFGIEARRMHGLGTPEDLERFHGLGALPV